MKVIVLPKAEDSLKGSMLHLSKFYDRRFLKNLERLEAISKIGEVS